MHHLLFLKTKPMSHAACRYIFLHADYAKNYNIKELSVQKSVSIRNPETSQILLIAKFNAVQRVTSSKLI